jgi:hypothetical protein
MAAMAVTARLAHGARAMFSDACGLAGALRIMRHS